MYPEFLVNIDQTNIIYQLTGGNMYKLIGLKQVFIVGWEEKCAYTLLTSISTGGDFLPFHVVYDEKTKSSLLLSKALSYNKVLGMSFQFVWSNTDTYWSTFKTMCTYIDRILVLFWMEKKQQQGVPLDQPCILQLDC
ncbi:hypothetical protein BDR05DRAFT_894140 [Suillus weaverae]|nr:hypothetical protein BDR05DRAFT_894140 [Suillus weaverae]